MSKKFEAGRLVAEIDPETWKLIKFLRAAESFRVRGGMFNFTPTSRYNICPEEHISEADQEEIIELRKRMATKYTHYYVLTDCGSAAELARAEVLRDYLKD